MQAFLIDPGAHHIVEVELDDGLQGIQRLIGYDSVDSDEIDDAGNRLYFDESCFIRDVPGAGRFRLDNLAPVAGRGVVVASDATDGPMRSPTIALEALKLRVRFE